MGLENVNPREELKRLEEQIKAATQLAELKPIYFRLNEIISSFAGDFDIWVAGNDVKQLLVSRGTLIQQGDIAPVSPPLGTAAPPPAEPAPPAAEPSATQTSISWETPPPPPTPTGLFQSPPPQTPAESFSSPAAPLKTSTGIFPPPSALPTSPPTAPPSWDLGTPPAAPPRTTTASMQPPASANWDTAPPLAPPPRPSQETPTEALLWNPTAFSPSIPPEPPPPAAPPLQSSTLFDFSEPVEPPPAPIEPPPAPMERPAASTPPRPPIARRPAAAPPGRKINPLFIAGPIAAVLAIVLGVYFVQHRSPKRNAAAPMAATVSVNVATAPPGAAVQFSGGGRESSCTSNCKVSLAPGTYQVSAALDGYKAATSTLTVTAQHAAAVNLTLDPQPPAVHFLTDLATGTVELDSLPPMPLQDGQLVLDNLAPGAHSVKVKGPNGDPSAAFTFELASAQQPVIGAGVTAKNMVAVLVASFGKQAHAVSNAGPWKLAVNGQPQAAVSPTGVDLTSFQPGVDEIVVGDGKDQRTLSDKFDASPTLTAFLKTDVNAGTLTVSTGALDGVRVFINDKEYRRPTQRGQLRLQALGKVTVRVSKNGFIDPPPQQVEVKKGAEVRLQFDLKPQPQFGSLGVHGAPPGTEVWIDQKNVGTVGPDGSFIFGSIEPGDRVVELHREQFLPKRLQRSFVAGREVELGGADVVLTAANGTVRLNRNPPSATITYRRADEAEAHEAGGNQVELPPGSYAFSASAPGFMASNLRVQVNAGENKEIDFNLTRERPAAPPPVVPKGMTEFVDAPNWTRDGESWVHKGGGFVAYKLPPKGVFTFTVQLLKGGGVFRSGAVRWCVEYVDSKNYLLSEMDRKNFWTGVIKNGERLERVKTPHNLGSQKAFTVKIDIAPDRLVQSLLVGNQWKVLDTFAEPGRDYSQGHFGFLIPGNDEIAISDFKFVAK